MGMKTQIKKIGDTVIVSIDGMLDYEVQEPLKNDLERIVSHSKTDSAATQLIFDFENLEFVGSCGISNFVQTLKEVSSKSSVRPRYTNVKSEFKRVMKAFDEENVFDFEEITPHAPKKQLDN